MEKLSPDKLAARIKRYEQLLVLIPAGRAEIEHPRWQCGAQALTADQNAEFDYKFAKFEAWLSELVYVIYVLRVHDVDLPEWHCRACKAVVDPRHFTPLVTITECEACSNET